MNDKFTAEFRHLVQPVYEACVEENKTGLTGMRRDLRAALEAAKVLYHLREQIPPPYTKTGRSDWRDVARQCPDYGLLGDVADTAKHGRLDDQTRSICNAHQIEERITVTEYEDVEGIYRHVDKAVWLNLTNGTAKDLLQVLTNVINFWQVELHSLGLIPNLPPYPNATRPQPLPGEQCNHCRLDFQLLAGVEYKQTFQFLRYNYATGRTEPIDISGSDFRFTVYKPQYSYELVATHDPTGKQITRNVQLSDEEREKFLALGTEIEQNAYLNTLPQVKAAYEEIVTEIRSTIGVNDC
jgi:hypothetical protein